MLHFEGRSFPLVVYAGPFMLWVVFFMLGVYFSSHSRNYSLPIPAVVTIVGLIASIFETCYYLGLDGSGVGIKLSSFIYSAGIILLLFSEKAERAFRMNPITRLVLYIGEISFAVYFAHVYVIMIVRHFTGREFWILNWTLVLTITVLLIALCKKILPEKFSRKYLAIR